MTRKSSINRTRIDSFDYFIAILIFATKKPFVLPFWKEQKETVFILSFLWVYSRMIWCRNNLIQNQFGVSGGISLFLWSSIETTCWCFATYYIISRRIFWVEICAVNFCQWMPWQSHACSMCWPMCRLSRYVDVLGRTDWALGRRDYSYFHLPIRFKLLKPNDSFVVIVCFLSLSVSIVRSIFFRFLFIRFDCAQLPWCLSSFNWHNLGCNVNSETRRARRRVNDEKPKETFVECFRVFVFSLEFIRSFYNEFVNLKTNSLWCDECVCFHLSSQIILLSKNFLIWPNNFTRRSIQLYGSIESEIEQEKWKRRKTD